MLTGFVCNPNVYGVVIIGLCVEHVVAKRDAAAKIHNEIIEVCRDYEEHLKAAGQDRRAGQPTPGNKAGSLSTPKVLNRADSFKMNATIQTLFPSRGFRTS